MHEMEASEYMSRLSALKDCRLSDLIYIRTCDEKTAKSFNKYQLEERKRYKEKVRKETEGTDFGRQVQEQETWAFWYSLKNRIPQSSINNKSEDKE